MGTRLKKGKLLQALREVNLLEETGEDVVDFWLDPGNTVLVVSAEKHELFDGILEMRLLHGEKVYYYYPTEDDPWEVDFTVLTT